MDIPIPANPSDMNPGSGDYPRLRLPAGRLFAERANRLRQLAQGHGLGDFLTFTAQLVEAQQTLFDTYPDIPLPDLTFLQRCQEHGLAPLAPAGWALDPSWRSTLAQLTALLMKDTSLTSAVRTTLTRLASAAATAKVPDVGSRDMTTPPAATKTGDSARPVAFEADGALAKAMAVMGTGGGADWLEAQARLVLAGDRAGLDLAAAPFIGAALQVLWTRLAAHLTPDQIAPPADKALCPVCGAPPVAGVIRAGGEDAGLRYLHCALCNSQWHRVRAECSHCGNDHDLGYYSLEGRQDDPVSAEACPACQGYLKICRLDKDHLAEPLADDLASLTLDLLMGEEGYARAGVNVLLWQGEAAG